MLRVTTSRSAATAAVANSALPRPSIGTAKSTTMASSAAGVLATQSSAFTVPSAARPTRQRALRILNSISSAKRNARRSYIQSSTSQLHAPRRCPWCVKAVCPPSPSIHPGCYRNRKRPVCRDAQRQHNSRICELHDKTGDRAPFQWAEWRRVSQRSLCE
jgi:hypothetical protein